MTKFVLHGEKKCSSGLYEYFNWFEISPLIAFEAFCNLNLIAYFKTQAVSLYMELAQHKGLSDYTFTD